MPEETKWLPTDEQVEQWRGEWIREVLSEDCMIFGAPHCAGYWLYGVEWDENLGWMAFEFDDSVDCEKIKHSKAIAAWKNGSADIPKKYYELDEAFAKRAFDIGVKKWGVGWRDNPDIDLGQIDNLIQWTLLGELRYG